jgi:hypothetical protein
MIARVSAVVAARGRWAKGTFNTFDVTRNLVFALHAYARFVDARFPSATPVKRPTDHIGVSADVPQYDLPEKLREQVTRLVRDTRVTRDVKRLDDYTCQLCTTRLEIEPGRHYAEGHHIRPLGYPHNGEDVRENVICVCPNCHVLLDYEVFLQLIMRKIRKRSASFQLANRKRTASKMLALQSGRAAVVVPNGTLFGDGVCARIKEELLKEFNLHTIVRLPNGVFSPYTSIPTNILFFDRSEPTRDVWYYEQPLPEGRKNYTKTAPIQFEEFAPLIAWCGRAGQADHREENERAWKVPASELLANGCNLDRKNPRAQRRHHPSPAGAARREHSRKGAAHCRDHR